MNKKKIINDPIYGFINIPYEILFDLMEHSWFQRLRRISQVGLTQLTYPGATHSRFHHALGAMHLMWESIGLLRGKGISITEEEARAACTAILLHDIGHGPFSHALEGTLIRKSHEDLSLEIMHALNDQFRGDLGLAIKIFTGEYPRVFLHQLVSGELDVDRLDYLGRDSFYTGVVEGKIGTNRIIKMMNVVDDELVIEEKGLYSIEKFLMARKIMYWQVYMHKTVLAVEKMLISAVSRMQMIIDKNGVPQCSQKFHRLLAGDNSLELFLQLDDTDAIYALKNHQMFSDPLLSYLSEGILKRKLFRSRLSTKPFSVDTSEKILEQLVNTLDIDENTARQLIFSGSETTQFYDWKPRQIKFLMKDGRIRPFEEISDLGDTRHETTKYYLVYPKMGM
ncbi:HD domain-containing protein [Membranicola marinus]|uniref:HD domain-containing protein n=1 Tax=Membranihabitans marinus TaxID=1227546 RepID=A0A953HTX0_9BACT|nr:HD domain-containing protein [Membranihabitans marinus]MBY5958355.1 HD domain-containing protein [Membranihabitans marinus]